MVETQVNLLGKNTNKWRVTSQGKVLGTVKNLREAKKLVREVIEREKVKSYIIRINKAGGQDGK